MMFAANAAANWRLPKLGKKKPKRIEALVVTGNFVESRVLAELIQQRLEQPMLLLPTGSEDDRCYYVPPSGQSLEVDDGDFLEFVRFLRPKKVLFLGSERYAPQAFHDKLIGAEIPTWAINNEDWGQIAASTEDLLQVKNLHLDYLVLIEQVDADGRIGSLQRDGQSAVSKACGAGIGAFKAVIAKAAAAKTQKSAVLDIEDKAYDPFDPQLASIVSMLGPRIKGVDQASDPIAFVTYQMYGIVRDLVNACIRDTPDVWEWTDEVALVSASPRGFRPLAARQPLSAHRSSALAALCGAPAVRPCV